MKKTIGSIVKHIVLLVLAVIWLVPIIWLVVTSFSGYKGTAHFFPTSWSMDNFVQLLTRPDSVVQYVSWFKNTLIIAVFTCIISTIFVIMVSYAMSCMRFNGRKQIMSASLILNMFPGPLDSNLLYPEDAGTYKQPFRYDHSLLSGIGTWIPHHEGIHGHNTNVT